MAFDFDDLEEQLPAGVPDIAPLSDEDFARFGERLRGAEERGDYADFDRALSEALWDGRAAEARAGRVVRDFVGLLREVAGGGGERREPSSSALVHALSRLSLSLSRDAVLARQPEPGRGRGTVALLLGHGGAHVDDLAPQANFYRAKGITTVSAVWCVFPVVLQQYQEVQLARELRDQLQGGGRLLVHLCGSHGHAAWSSFADLWHRGQEPFSELPSLQDCLRAVVWECGPPSDDSLSALKAKPPKGGGKPRLSLEDARRMQRELFAKFSSDDFQDQLEKLEASHERGSSTFLAERNRLFLEVQAPVIEQYGFEPNQRGVLAMLQAAARWNGDEDYARNRDHLNNLLGLGEEASSERRRRTEVAREEWAALQKRRQPAPASEQAEAELRDAEAVDYGEDKTGAAVGVDFALRALLARCAPEVELTALIRQLPLVREAILDACTYGAFWLGDDYGGRTDSGRPLQAEFATWAAIDAAAEPAVPRLFLYSKRDAVVPAEAVERCIRAVRRCNPDAEVCVQACAEGAHMGLWAGAGQRHLCARALTELLQKAGLLDG